MGIADKGDCGHGMNDRDINSLQIVFGAYRH
jgi:hypothetical protein